ncbi:MAG: N-acetyltransferase [Actinomycetes bacterium]
MAGQVQGSGSAGGVEVREARESDLAAVAALHVQAFPGSVLGELGVEAVRRSYKWQLTGPHDLTALVTASSGTVTGFLFGGVFRGSTIGFVKAERWFLVTRVARHPGILLRSVGWKRITLGVRLLLRRSSPAVPEKPDDVPRKSFGVLAIAVDPKTQGQGLGAILMREATKRAKAQGYVSMHLTVHPTNTSAVAFYRSLGWTEFNEANGTWVGRMTLSLEVDAAPLRDPD